MTRANRLKRVTIRVGIGLLWLAAFMLTNPLLSVDDQTAIASAAFFAGALGVVVAYLSGSWRALTTPEIRLAHFLVLGIFIAWARNLFAGAWAWALRYFDRPPSMEISRVPAALLWIGAGAAILHLIASGAGEHGEIIPHRALRVFGAVIAALVFIVAGLLYLTYASDTRVGNEIIDILENRGR